MTREDWLRSYGELEEIGAVLNRLSRRSARLGPIHGSVEDLVRDYDALESDFLAFYPEVQRFAEASRNGKEPDSL